MSAATLLRPLTATVQSVPPKRTFVHGRPHADLGHCYEDPTGGYLVHTIGCRRSGTSAPRASTCVAAPEVAPALLACVA